LGEFIIKDFFMKKFERAVLNYTPVKMDANFDQQVDTVFQLVDINQSGCINKQELKMGCKKLGLNLNDDEVNNLFESFKSKDGQQSLNKNEFIDLIGYKFRNDLVKPATVIDRLKTEISIVDIHGTGFLDSNQLTNLYNRMGLTISDDEVQGIIAEIGDAKTEEVLEDKLLQAVIGKDLRFRSKEMNRAMIKLRGASSPSLGEFINSFANMPENYFLSFTETLQLYGQNLPTSSIAPILSNSGFYYTNLFPPLNSVDPNFL
jgi:Ca2+-binding EF-hand superfamily protein